MTSSTLAVNDEFGILKKIGSTPVDEDLFMYCLQTYSAAASMRMPTASLMNEVIHVEGQGDLTFSDIPENRGMFAVMAELNDQKLPSETFMSISMRITGFSQIASDRGRLAKWFRPSSDNDGSFECAESLMRACASATIVFVDDDMGFDLDEIERLTEEIHQRLVKPAPAE